MNSEKLRQRQLDYLVQAADAVALAFAECAGVQMSSLALPIAKRLGRSQPDPTLKLGDAGFAALIQNIRSWINELPKSCRTKIYEGQVWPHRCTNPKEVEELPCLPLHVPATPTGAETVGYAIHQVLCELGDILAEAGFNTHDIGTLYDSKSLPHLGILLRFGWSNEMRELFAAYQTDMEALEKIAQTPVPLPPPPQPPSPEALREKAISMWDTI